MSFQASNEWRDEKEEEDAAHIQERNAMALWLI